MTKIQWADETRAAILKARFWAYVEKSAGCWEWRGGLFSGGYGQFRWGSRKMRAHRVSWQLANGDVPVGMCVCHRCDNRKCVRPDHLFLGTQADNIRDRDSKGRGPKGRPNPKNSKPGESNPSAKLCREDVDRIRILASSGYTQRAIATAFRMSESQIGNIVHGRCWRENG